jgi:predicted nucleic acid-binding protein
VGAVPAHVLLETASVLTRLPSGLAQPLGRVSEALVRLFPQAPLQLPAPRYQDLLRTLGRSGLRGGAVYDALIAATAVHHGALLLTLDRRASSTYAALGAPVRHLA